MKNLRDTFITALNDEGITQKQFAEARGIDPAQVTIFLKDQKALSGKIKPAIFSKWKNPAVPVVLFHAHMQDEIEAAGLSDTIKSITINLK